VSTKETTPREVLMDPGVLKPWISEFACILKALAHVDGVPCERREMKPRRLWTAIRSHLSELRTLRDISIGPGISGLESYLP
jgi:hypothetical protein